MGLMVSFNLTDCSYKLKKQVFVYKYNPKLLTIKLLNKCHIIIKDEYMKKFLVIFLLMCGMTFTFGQGAVSIPVYLTDGDATATLYFGIDLTATDEMDAALGETDLAPMPPAGAMDVRFEIPPYGSADPEGELNSISDYRPAASSPFTGSHIHRLKWQLGVGTTMTISMDLPAGISVNLQDLAAGGLLLNQTITGTGSVTVTNSFVTAVQFTATYTNVDVTPVVSGPVFGAAPASLVIVPTAVGSSNTGTVTVSNTGTADLEITNVVSSDAQFTVAPTTATIAAGTNADFTVTFTPASLGAKSTTLTFTHNAPAAGTTTNYSVSGTGASAGPTFAFAPAIPDTIKFGSVGVGTADTIQIQVNNDGLTNPLSITGITSSIPEFSVQPPTATIAAGGHQLFNVIFTPSSGSNFEGTLSFASNDPSSPAELEVTGSGVATYGLVFAADSIVRKEDSTYTDYLSLKALSQTAQAIQFRLLVNKKSDDDKILTIMNVSKGPGLAAHDSSNNWSLEYNIFRGGIQANGSSVDSVYVLLYDLNLAGGLPAGSYDSLLAFNYRVADLPALADTQKSSFRITNAEASTYAGNSIDITPSNDALIIMAMNRVPSKGDVNGDGYLDILDLINVVDHIVGRDSLFVTDDITGVVDSSAFLRADIAPWGSPDNLVNVQDLALIQNIILTGYYPDGTRINKTAALLAKSSSSDVKVIFYITENGISINTESADLSLRGVQLEFGNVTDNILSLSIDSKLGTGNYAKINDLLRVLLYDQAGSDIIETGNNYVASLPFSISNPKSIGINKVIVVTEDLEKISDPTIEVKYSENPSIVSDYALEQNFPNPFNPSTTVRFSVPETNMVKITIYNALGERVRSLFLGEVEQGNHSVKWDGRDDSGRMVSSGMYIYKMTAGSFSDSKKMIFLK
jgi:hypothetical protein